MLCYVYFAGKYKENKQEADFKTYKLPDDSIVRLSTERYQIPEIMFDPKLIGLDQPGLHQNVFQSIMKSNTEIRAEMFKNIVLAGGNTLFDKFSDRLNDEIYNMAPTKTYIKIEANKERLYSSWIGGSIIGNMDTFQSLCITRKEYEENPRIIHDKTF